MPSRECGVEIDQREPGCVSVCGVSLLILLNGAPATGKSTLARRYVAGHPLALNLDLDLVRGLLGDWRSSPGEAGLAARAIGLAAARTHLREGHDVVVPQLVARAQFIEELAATATDAGAEFVEIMPTIRTHPGQVAQAYAALLARLAERGSPGARITARAGRDDPRRGPGSGPSRG